MESLTRALLAVLVLSLGAPAHAGTKEDAVWAVVIRRAAIESLLPDDGSREAA